MERRFNCTSCGRCCFGSIPLTLDDAVLHAARFPLALVWTVVPQGAKAFALATRLGVTLKLPKRGRLAAVIAPTAYIPPSLPCPELSSAGLCGIHGQKPQRCRTMPFYPYREESDQADLLAPRPGWECDTSPTAPVVYRDGRIVDAADFAREREALLGQAALMRQYAEYMLKYSPWIADNLQAMAAKPGGQLLTSLSSFLTAARRTDARDIAALQLPLLQRFAAATATLTDAAEHHRNYLGWAREMSYLTQGADCNR